MAKLLKIPSKMQSLLDRGRSLLGPAQNGGGGGGGGDGSFTTVKVDAQLFPKPDPKVDGDECLHDCASCTITYPAKFSIEQDDKLYGHIKGWHTHLIVGTGKTDWVRDVTDEKGSVMQALGKHGLEYQHGGSDSSPSAKKTKARLLLSASNLPTGSELGDDDLEEGSNCLLLPSWQLIEHVQPAEVPQLMHDVIERSVTNTMPLSTSLSNGTASDGNATLTTNGTTTTNGATTNGVSTNGVSTNGVSTNGASTNGTTTHHDDHDDTHDLETKTASLTLTRSLTASPFAARTRTIPHAALILMCSHRTRDARCGQSAPLLRTEFERHLRPLGLYRDLHDERPGGVGIYFINHVGGHKYSANVIIYRRRGGFPRHLVGGGSSSSKDDATAAEEAPAEATQGIWLARVRPADCENIVRYTILQGKVVKPESQLRGGFDRERGVLSW